MKNKLKTPDVHDRIKLACPGRTLVMEYIDGYDEDRLYQRYWRVIDLDTGEVFGKSARPQDIASIASEMTHVKGSPAPEYVREATITTKYITFKEIPLADKLRHIQSHANDLEQRLLLDRCPLEAAMEDYQQRYSHKCWYQEEDGNWEIDCDV